MDKSLNDKVVSSFIYALFILGIVQAILLKNDWAGWILFGSSFLVIYKAKIFTEYRALFWTVFFIILAHQLISITNTYWFFVIGGNIDAVYFTQTAKQLAKIDFYKYYFLYNTPNTPESLARAWNIIQHEPNIYFTSSAGSSLYIQLLAFFYLICPSTFFGAQISNYFFIISLICFIKFLQPLNLSRKTTVITILIFGLNPALLLWTSITLSEAFQLMFLILSCYFAIKWQIEIKKIFFCAMCLSLLILSVAHKGFAILAISMFILFNLNKKVLQIKKQKIIFTIFLFCLLFLGFKFLLNDITLFNSTFIQHILNLKIFKFIANYRNALTNSGGHTTYFSAIDFSSISNIFFSLIKMWTYYLFSPWPWEIHNKAEIFVMLYAWARTFLTLTIVFEFRNLSTSSKIIYSSLLGTYILVTFLFSLGTCNYGTALRHQIISDWIIWLLGVKNVICLVENLKNKWNEKLKSTTAVATIQMTSED